MMRKLIRARLSWALIVAIVAVAISIPALAVGNTAGSGARAHAAKKHKKRGGGKRGPRGLTGLQGPMGPTGPQGTKGDTGPAGSARGYALVNSDASYDTARSKNVVSVSKEPGVVLPPSGGSYCIAFNGVDSATSIAEVSPEKGGDTTALAGVAHAEWDRNRGSCPAGSFRVKTYESFSDCSGTDDAGNSECTFANNPRGQSFTIAVP